MGLDLGPRPTGAGGQRHVDGRAHGQRKRLREDGSFQGLGHQRADAVEPGAREEAVQVRDDGAQRTLSQAQDDSTFLGLGLAAGIFFSATQRQR